MRIFAKSEIVAALDRTAILNAVRDGFIQHAAGETNIPPPAHLEFPEANGDAHVKCGAARGLPYFAVKIATGFYDNEKLGLPVNNGLVLVLSARTGRPEALLADEGWLTTERTAAAGALVAQALAPPAIARIGIIGTGEQARAQLAWLQLATPCRAVAVFGRNRERAERFVADMTGQGFDVSLADSPEAVAGAATLIVTTTPARAPLFPADAVQPGTHVTAVGADMPGKQELDPALFRRAASIVLDDRTQCLDHGEFGHAVRQGVVARDVGVLLGDVLAGRARGRMREGDITIADLTGVGIQDVAIAGLACARLVGEGSQAERG
jgi:ornithine cyclodeaminase